MATRTETKLLQMAPEKCLPVLHSKLDPVRARELATAFKALADPTRVQIVSLLLGTGEAGLCVCDIVSNFPLGQPTVSHHLKVLRDARLVRARKGGLWVHYSANREHLTLLGIVLPVLQMHIERSECSDEEYNSMADGEKNS